MLDLLFFLILGHYFGDFALQSDRVALKKRESKIYLTLHVFIYTSTIVAFLVFGLFYREDISPFFSLTTVAIIVFLFIQHWVQDYIKARWFNGSRQGFYLDQAIHILVLYLIRLYVYN
ncbi:MAG: DUF3307 domain-containing protein [Candidatus Thermoplasmatota archaeon]|nr:DUF3307 domain-containing protein [Candidatus Thermoplasmatota archaeon]